MDSSATIHPRKALFVFSILQYYREMSPVPEFFQQRGYEIHILLGFSGATAEEAANRCEELGFCVHHVPPDMNYGDHLAAHGASDSSEKPGKQTLIRKLTRFFRQIIELLRLPRTLRKYVKRHQKTRQYGATLIQDIGPDIVFGGPFHSCGRFDNAIARYCTIHDIPYCCLSMSPYITNDDEVRFINLASGMLPKKLRSNHSLTNRSLSHWFPSWTRTRDGETIFMWDPIEMFSAWLTSMMEKDPWQKPSSQYSALFVECELSREMLLARHYESGNIVHVGKPLLDQVFANLTNEEYRRQLYCDLGLADGEPFLLFNVEPSAEHRYASWDDHWVRFHALMDRLAQEQVNVILSLHPLCDPSNYRFVQEQYNFTLSEKYKIAELFPYCSLSVSYPCSTNHLASEFNKPQLIYDFFEVTRRDSLTGQWWTIPHAQYSYTMAEFSDQLEDHLAEIRTDPCMAAELHEKHVPACQRIYNYVKQKFALSETPMGSEGLTIVTPDPLTSQSAA